MFDFLTDPYPRVYKPGELEDIWPGGAVYQHLGRLESIFALRPSPNVAQPGTELTSEDMEFYHTDTGWMGASVDPEDRRESRDLIVFTGESRLSPWDVDCRVVREAFCPDLYFDAQSLGVLVCASGIRPVSLFAQRRPNVVIGWMRGVAHGDESFGGLDRVLEMHPDMYFLLDACRCSPECLDYAKASPVLMSLLAMALIEEHADHGRIYNSSQLGCLYALSWLAGPSLGPLRAAYNIGYALRRARDVCDTDPRVPELAPFHNRVWHLHHSGYGQACMRLHQRATTMLGSLAVALDPEQRYKNLGRDLCEAYHSALDAAWVSVTHEQVDRHELDMGRYTFPRPNCCPVDGWWVSDTSVPSVVKHKVMTYRVGFLDDGPGAGVLGAFYNSDIVRKMSDELVAHARKKEELFGRFRGTPL